MIRTAAAHVRCTGTMCRDNILAKSRGVSRQNSVTAESWVLLRMQTVKQFPQLVLAGAINHPASAIVRSLAKEQLAAKVAVGVQRVHQFQARRKVEMILVGHYGVDFVQVVVS